MIDAGQSKGAGRRLVSGSAKAAPQAIPPSWEHVFRGALFLGAPLSFLFHARRFCSAAPVMPSIHFFVFGRFMKSLI
jgi:hypothetical protein